MPLMLRAFSVLNRGLYRASNGRIGGRIAGAPVLLLTTTGRTSGKPRTVPLAYLEDRDALVVVASYGGRPTDPAWLRNIRANPDVEVEVGSERRRMRARVASSEERTRLWPGVVEMYPTYERYQERTTREIPLVLLSPS